MPASTLTIGLLGAGRIGKVHAAAIAATPGARLVSVADALPEAAAGLAGEHDATVASIDEIIADAGVDAVFITTPTDMHSDLIEQAAVAGKAIFCEKPIDLVGRARPTLPGSRGGARCEVDGRVQPSLRSQLPRRPGARRCRRDR